MKLPSYVLECLNALEAAGYPAYVVGGCVRDACLGLQPHDYDICTAAVPQQTEAVFAGKKLVLAGEKHGTVGVVTAGGVVEITTFRTEGAYRDNRHPDWVKFVDSVESDLARRDYTVNAMAYSPTRGFADPFGGRGDLESKVLRAVGDPVTRFQEDSLRILRGVRFAVKYGLTVDPATEDAMESQAQLMDNLAEERVFDELCKLLPLVSAEDLCRFAPILGAVIPGIAAHDRLRPAQSPPRLRPVHPHCPRDGGRQRRSDAALGGAASRHRQSRHLYPGRHRPGAFLRPRPEERGDRRRRFPAAESPHGSAGAGGAAHRPAHGTADPG